MDFDLADDTAMQLMLEEYSKLLDRQAGTLAYIHNDTPSSNGVFFTPQSFCFGLRFLFLYIILDLRYNTRYGTQIFDTDRSVGRLQCNRSPFGSINNIR